MANLASIKPNYSLIRRITDANHIKVSNFDYDQNKLPTRWSNKPLSVLDLGYNNNNNNNSNKNINNNNRINTHLSHP